jgi:hypothetical protein
MHAFTALFPFDGIFDVLCQSSFRLLVTLTIYQSSNHMWIWAGRQAGMFDFITLHQSKVRHLR